MLSTMRYHTSVVIYLFGALGTLGSSSRKLMRLSAYAERIMDMQKSVKGLASDTAGMGPASCVYNNMGPTQHHVTYYGRWMWVELLLA